MSEHVGLKPYSFYLRLGFVGHRSRRGLDERRTLCLLILLQAALFVFLAAAARAGIVSPGLGYHAGHFTQHGAPAKDEALLTDLRFHQLLLGFDQDLARIAGAQGCPAALR